MHHGGFRAVTASGGIRNAIGPRSAGARARPWTYKSFQRTACRSPLFSDSD